MNPKDIADAARRKANPQEPPPITYAEVDAAIRARWPGAGRMTTIPEWLRVYVRSLMERARDAERKAADMRADFRRVGIWRRGHDAQCLLCRRAWNTVLGDETHDPDCPLTPT